MIRSLQQEIQNLRDQLRMQQELMAQGPPQLMQPVSPLPILLHPASFFNTLACSGYPPCPATGVFFSLRFWFLMLFFVPGPAARSRPAPSSPPSPSPSPTIHNRCPSRESQSPLQPHKTQKVTPRDTAPSHCRHADISAESAKATQDKGSAKTKAGPKKKSVDSLRQLVCLNEGLLCVFK